MVAIALHTVLAPGREQDYEDVHRTIPTELAAALAGHGVRDWRIWRAGRDVFHLVDVDDVATFHAMRRALLSLPANQAWQATVGPMFEQADDYEDADPTLPLLWSLQEQQESAQQR